MTPAFRSLALGLLLLVPAAAHAQAPILTTISDVSLNAGGTATVSVVAYDPNGDPITLTSTLPSFATLNAPTTGTGLVATTITLLPATAGTFTGSVTATAGAEADTEEFQITVNSVGTNLGPAVMVPAVWTVVEGQPLTLVVTASDVNGDAITSLMATGLPSGATFTSNASHTVGTVTWTPTTTQAGQYDVTFTAANSLQGSATTHLVVLESGTGNDYCPTITSASMLTINEGQALTFQVNVGDADNDNTTITATGLPTGATFNDNDNNTGTFTWTPSTTQSGVYVVTFMVNDNAGCIQTATTVITVSESGANQCPVITVTPPTLTVVEGQHFAFNVTASDPDGGGVDLMALNVPTGATFTDNGNNTGTLDWTPGSTQAGVYTVIFVADDSEGCTPTATLVVTVNEGTGNQCPMITAPATQTVNEGQTVAFTVTASDPDGGGVTLTASGLPSGATFNGGTGFFGWTPSSIQSGTYTVTFSANDNEGCTQTATTVLTVNDVGGGGGEATGTLIGRFNTRKKFVCFRVVPVNGSFDLRNVMLGSLVISLNGNEVEALPGKTHLEFECEDDDDGDHDGEDDDGDHDGEDCDECEDDDGHDEDDCENDDDGDCEVSHLRVCFSMSELRDLFGESDFLDQIASATIHGQLTTGGSIVVTLNGGKFANGDHPGKGKNEKRKMHARVFPNPLNPTGELSFTLAQAGRVRVGVYDARGRLVKTLLDENRAAGPQTILWDGTDSRSGKVSSGVYFFRIVAAEGSEVVRVTLLK